MIFPQMQMRAICQNSTRRYSVSNPVKCLNSSIYIYIYIFIKQKNSSNCQLGRTKTCSCSSRMFCAWHFHHRIFDAVQVFFLFLASLSLTPFGNLNVRSFICIASFWCVPCAHWQRHTRDTIYMPCSHCASDSSLLILVQLIECLVLFPWFNHSNENRNQRSHTVRH